MFKNRDKAWDLCQSSSLRHLRCYNMSPTLDVFRYLLVTYRAVLR